MKKQNYFLPIGVGSERNQAFEFLLEGDFFEQFGEGHDLLNGTVHIKALLSNESQAITVNLSYNGHILKPCDRCLDPVTIPIEGESTLYVKFGEEHSEIDEDVWVVSQDEHQIDVGNYMFENIILQISMRNIHPDDETGASTCNSDALAVLAQLQEQVEYAKSDEENPWNELNKLKKANK